MMDPIAYLFFVGIMVTGFTIGLLIRGRQGIIQGVERVTKPVIFVLLFLMGVSIGLDEQTMNNLWTIGLSSLGFAVFTIVGSMLVLALVLPVAGRGFARREEKVAVKAEVLPE